jgi:hypothetical protein
MALGHGMRNGTMFGLSTEAGNCGLAFGGPGHQIVAKEDIEPEGGAACI